MPQFLFLKMEGSEKENKKLTSNDSNLKDYNPAIKASCYIDPSKIIAYVGQI